MVKEKLASNQNNFSFGDPFADKSIHNSCSPLFKYYIVIDLFLFIGLSFFFDFVFFKEFFL